MDAYVSVAAEVLQKLDLAQRALGENLLAEDIGDLLDGDALAGAIVVVRRADDAVCALAQLFGDGVAFVNDEVLVEDLEHLAALQGRVGHFCG